MHYICEAFHVTAEGIVGTAGLELGRVSRALNQTAVERKHITGP